MSTCLRILDPVSKSQLAKCMSADVLRIILLESREPCKSRLRFMAGQSTVVLAVAKRSSISRVSDGGQVCSPAAH